MKFRNGRATKDYRKWTGDQDFLMGRLFRSEKFACSSPFRDDILCKKYLMDQKDTKQGDTLRISSLYLSPLLQSDWLPYPLSIRWLIVSGTYTSNATGIKHSYSKSILREKQNSKKMWYKKIEGKKWMNLKYQFDSFTLRIVAGVSSALVVWINSIIVYQKSIVLFCLFSRDFY